MCALKCEMVYKYFSQDRSNQSLLMLPNMLKSILSSDIYHLANFNNMNPLKNCYIWNLYW